MISWKTCAKEQNGTIPFHNTVLSHQTDGSFVPRAYPGEAARHPGNYYYLHKQSRVPGRWLHATAFSCAIFSQPSKLACLEWKCANESHRKKIGRMNAERLQKQTGKKVPSYINDEGPGDKNQRLSKSIVHTAHNGQWLQAFLPRATWKGNHLKIAKPFAAIIFISP